MTRRALVIPSRVDAKFTAQTAANIKTWLEEQATEQGLALKSIDPNNPTSGMPDKWDLLVDVKDGFTCTLVTPIDFGALLVPGKPSTSIENNEDNAYSIITVKVTKDDVDFSLNISADMAENIARTASAVQLRGTMYMTGTAQTRIYRNLKSISLLDARGTVI